MPKIILPYAIISADATNDATTLTLVNEIKKTLNALLGRLRDSGLAE